jgi:hypothetical protein
VWTDSWLSIAGAGCGLTGIGAGEEQAQKVITGEASRCGEDSRLGSRDLVASGVKCRPHGGKNSGTKSWTVSWLSLKTKVEPGLRGSLLTPNIGTQKRLTCEPNLAEEHHPAGGFPQSTLDN